MRAVTSRLAEARWTRSPRHRSGDTVPKEKIQGAFHPEDPSALISGSLDKIEIISGFRSAILMAMGAVMQR